MLAHHHKNMKYCSMVYMKASTARKQHAECHKYFLLFFYISCVCVCVLFGVKIGFCNKHFDVIFVVVATIRFYCVFAKT